MNTMLVSGIAMMKALEITAAIVGNEVYKKILEDAMESVKGGRSLQILSFSTRKSPVL